LCVCLEDIHSFIYTLGGYRYSTCGAWHITDWFVGYQVGEIALFHVDEVQLRHHHFFLFLDKGASGSVGEYASL
jgi:hypothetical protein